MCGETRAKVGADERSSKDIHEYGDIGCDNVKAYELEPKDERKYHSDQADGEIDNDGGKRRVAKYRQQYGKAEFRAAYPTNPPRTPMTAPVKNDKYGFRRLSVDSEVILAWCLNSVKGKLGQTGAAKFTSRLLIERSLPFAVPDQRTDKSVNPARQSRIF